MDCEHPADVEVLTGLRLDAFMGGYCQNHQIDPSNARQHVADEALVTGNVHETEAQSLSTFTSQFQVGETKINSYPPALFLFQAVGVDSGQSLDQPRFPVINVAGGADDD